MNSLKQILEEVLSEVKPRPEDEERVNELLDRVVDALKAETSSRGLTVEVEVYGSVAKGTWLRGDVDLDVFLRADKGVPRDRLIGEGLEAARSVFEKLGGRWVERYAEHPYVEGWLGNIRVDVVPCYKVRPGEWMTAVDRTPYHTEYVRAKLSPEMRDQVRLLKKFMKGVGVYGADIKTGGFSGYLCELLTIRYGGFVETLEDASKRWRRGFIIDIENYYRNKEGEARKRFPHPLIVVDPVDPRRNAAAAVRVESLCRFITASKLFLKKPSKVFFDPPKPETLTFERFRERIGSRELDLVAVVFGPVGAVPDVVWGQLYRSLDSLRSLLENWGFKVYRARAWTDEKTTTVLLFELEKSILTRFKLHRGPPVFSREFWRFMDKYLGSSSVASGPWVEGDRLMVEVERRFKDAVLLLRSYLENDGGASVGVRGKVAEAVKRGFKVLRNLELWEVLKSNDLFNRYMSEFLDGLPTWLKSWVEEPSKGE